MANNVIFYISDSNVNEASDFWNELENSDVEGCWHKVRLLSRNLFIPFYWTGSEDDEEESTALKEVVLNFADFEKRWVA